MICRQEHELWLTPSEGYVPWTCHVFEGQTVTKTWRVVVCWRYFVSGLISSVKELGNWILAWKGEGMTCVFPQNVLRHLGENTWLTFPEKSNVCGWVYDWELSGTWLTWRLLGFQSRKTSNTWKDKKLRLISGINLSFYCSMPSLLFGSFWKQIKWENWQCNSVLNRMNLGYRLRQFSYGKITFLKHCRQWAKSWWKHLVLIGWPINELENF